MTDDLSFVIKAANELVDELSPPVLMHVATAIETATMGDWNDIFHRAQHAVASQAGREAIGRFIKVWSETARTWTPAAIAFGLGVTSQTAENMRQMEALELVRSGPMTAVPLRLTPYVVQHVINAAQQDLLVVSHPIFDSPEIVEALLAAMKRNVRLRIVEFPKEVSGEVARYALTPISHEVLARAEIYHWPPEQPPKPGEWFTLMQVKCVIADETIMMLPDAECTEESISFHMVIALLVSDGQQPKEVAQQFNDLIEMGVLVREQHT